MKILVVEDNSGIVENLQLFLEARSHEVTTATDGVAGLELAGSGQFDVIVLDVRLPKLSGFDLCRRLRMELRCNTPVLFLTALDSLEEKLEGFSAGADDYLVKPFALKEVEARLHALTSRGVAKAVRRSLTVGELSYDPDAQGIFLRGVEVKLPPKCVRILAALMEQPNRVFSRSELERIAWGNDEGRAESMRAHISILRRALTLGDSADVIRTVHGVGYRLNLDATSLISSAPPSEEDSGTNKHVGPGGPQAE